MKSLTKRTLVTSAVLVSLVSATTLFASVNKDNNDKYEYKSKKDRMYENRDYHKKHGDSSKFLMRLLQKVNLTDDQKAKIDQFTNEYKSQRTKIFEAFSTDGFDKQKYIEAHKNKKEDMVVARADFIEKVYSVLTPAQKQQIKTQLDDFGKRDYKKEYKDKKRECGK